MKPTQPSCYSSWQCQPGMERPTTLTTSQSTILQGLALAASQSSQLLRSSKPACVLADRRKTYIFSVFYSSRVGARAGSCEMFCCSGTEY